MSDSSNCVTCGMLTQLAADAAPRSSGSGSAARSRSRRTWRIGGSAPKAAPEPARARATAPRHHRFDERLDVVEQDSALVAVPRTRPRFTPSSRANLRTEGDACASPKLASSIGGNPPRAAGIICCTPCGAAVDAPAGLSGVAAGDGAAAAAAGAAVTAANPFTVTTARRGQPCRPWSRALFR